jgi:hypothetical protein
MEVRMKRRIGVLAGSAALAVALSAAPAMAAGNGNIVKDCFGKPYGQTGLQYGQLKQDAPHPLGGGYGVPAVLAAHGPDGAEPLCG